MSFVNLV